MHKPKKKRSGHVYGEYGRKIKTKKRRKKRGKNVNINQNSPEILTNPIYTPAFLREQIGRLMRVEF